MFMETSLNLFPQIMYKFILKYIFWLSTNNAYMKIIFVDWEKVAEVCWVVYKL